MGSEKRLKDKQVPTSRPMPSQSMSNGHLGRQNPHCNHLTLIYHWAWHYVVWNISLDNLCPSHFLSPPPFHWEWALHTFNVSSCAVFGPTHELSNDIQLLYSLLSTLHKACPRSIGWSICSSRSASALWRLTGPTQMKSLAFWVAVLLQGFGWFFPFP